MGGTNEVAKSGNWGVQGRTIDQAESSKSILVEREKLSEKKKKKKGGGKR